MAHSPRRLPTSAAVRALSGALACAVSCLALYGPAHAGLATQEEGVRSFTVARHTLTSHQGAVRALAFTPDGKVLATGGEDGKVVLWLVEDGREWRSFDEGGPITALAFSVDGALLFSGVRTAAGEGAITVRDIVLDKVQRRLEGHAAEVTGLALGPLGASLISVGADGRLQRWDAQLGAAQTALQDDSPLTSASLSADGKLLLAGALEGEASRGLTVRLWDLEKGRLERRLVGQSGAVAGVALSPSGEWAAAAAASGAHLWKARDSDSYNKLTGQGAATAVAFRDDNALLAGAVGARVRLWDPEQHQLRGLVVPGQEVTALAFVPGGKGLATAGKDGSVKLWDMSPLAGKLPTPEPLLSLLELKPLVDTWDKGRGADTKARLQALATRYPKDADTLLLLAQATFLHSEGKEMPLMRQLLEKGLALEPGHYWIHRLLGEIDYQTQQYDAAAVHLQAVVDQNPNAGNSLARLAAIAGAKKDPAKATLLAGRVWQLLPSETAAYNLACAFSLQQKTGEALDWLERAFKLGFASYDGLKNDTDLDNVRGLARYAQLVRDYSKGEATAGTAGTPERADQLRAQADAARQAEKREESIALYTKSIAEERACPKPRESKIRRDLLWLATAHRSAGHTEAAIHDYEECVQLSDRVGGGTDDDVGTMGRQLLAGMYKSTGQHAKSLELYLKVLPSVRARGEKGLEAVALQNVGRAYAYLGRYDKALDYLNQAQALLEATERAGASAGEKSADTLSNLLSVLDAKGEVYAGFGQPEKAMQLYQQELRLARAQGTVADQFNALSSVATTLQNTGKLEQAVALFNEYLALAKAKNDPAKLSLAANYLAQCYSRWGKMDEALVWSNEALTRARQTGTGLHSSLISTARLYEKKGDGARALALMEEELALTRKGGDEEDLARSLAFVADVLPEGRGEEAVKMLTESLVIYQRRDDAPRQASTHKDLGLLLLKRDRYAESVSHLSTAVQLYEQLRKTAQGEARRDFLAKTVITYEALILAQLRNHDTPGAFRTMELSRSKLLAERIAGADQVSIPQIAELPGLAGAGAILMFSNADLDQPVHFVMNKSGMQAWPRPLPAALKQRLEGSGPLGQAAQAQAAAERDRGLKVKHAGSGAGKERTPLERAVELYRSLLILPSAESSAAARELGKLFYEALIEPSLKYLVPGQTLLIVPDGVLAFLPFETLIDPQGRYLADVYDIRYVQSLSVLQQIRKRFLPPGRKPLLAFGGAVYSQATYAQDMKPEGPALLAMADTGPAREFTRGASARDAYAAMGVRWDNLPGTLAEVKALQQLIPGAELVTGEGVNEAALKRLSESGELARYQTLHFATHGMVVPEQPELSALVLSQTGAGAEGGGQDGYLLMDEIAQLKLQADFVALSACETGLGKIYGGEGVVGLTQAFLIAGANGLSVSLWQVADESTARFMLEVYKLQRAGAHDWPAAISAVKRRFAKGDFGAAWKDPHYWAPFVYYGR